MKYSAQYFPGEIPTPYGPAQARESEETGKDRTLLYIGLGVAAIILILVIVIVLSPSEKPELDDKDEFELNRTKAEDRTYCGNGRCDIDENTEKCCIDCGCPLDTMECLSGECIFPEPDISDEEAERLAEEYAESKGIDPYLVQVSGTGTYDGLPCKFVMVKTFEEGFMEIAVLEDGTVAEAGGI